MAVDLKDLQGHVERDHARASELLSKASAERQAPMGSPVDDMGFNPPPNLAAKLYEMSKDRDRGLRQIENDPFFAKVETDMSLGGRYTFYITKARTVMCELGGDGWTICSWTSPAPSRLLDQPVGHEERIKFKTKGNAFSPPKEHEEVYTVLAAAKYGNVFPRLRKASYSLESGKAYVEDAEEFLREVWEQVAPPPEKVPALAPVQLPEAETQIPAPPTVVEVKPHEPYKAAEHFGLSEIIALTSVDQRTAMHLPFSEHVMIEGPPGSGKTSIGIMRIPCLIDQQWDDLDLVQGKDEPRYRPEWTRVLVLNPEMVPYLKDLITSLLDVDAQRVKVSTFRDFFRQVARDCHTLAGREANEGAALSRLKGEPAVLRCVWAGYQAFLRELLEEQANTIKRALPGDIAAAAVRLSFPENTADLPFEILEVASKLVGQEANDVTNDPTAPETSLPVAVMQEAARGLFTVGPEKPSKRWLDFRARIIESAEMAWSQFEEWFKAVQVVEVSSDFVLPASVNLAVRIARWCELRRSALQHLRGDAARRALLPARASEEVIRDLFNKVVPSVTRIKQITSTSEFGALLKQAGHLGMSFSELADAHQAWRTQLEQANPVYSEQDAVIGAWLGFHLAVLPVGGPRRIVGHEKEKLTHILIDEGQDLSPIHGLTLFRFLDKGGTVTVVGDLRQRVTRDRGLRKWSDLGIDNMRLAAFKINYRQSQPLGMFIKQLHQTLFSESPLWEPSSRPGAKPRVCFAGEGDDIAAIVAAEVRHIRSFIPRATVGIVYDDGDTALTPTVLEQLRGDVEDHLQNDLVPARLVPQRDGVGQINQFDCAIIVSVLQTKGLEFDGVVILDSSGKWAGAEGKGSDVLRNRFYVAGSRAKQALSIVAPADLTLLKDLLNSGLCMKG